MNASKLFFCLAAAALTVAAEAAFDYRKSTDPGAVEAALKKERSPRLKLLGAVRLAELRNPAEVAKFSGVCKLIDKTAKANRIAPRVTEDAKITAGFSERRYAADAYRYAMSIGHPYELRFMARPDLQKTVDGIYTPEARYTKFTELLKRHSGRIAEWNRAYIAQELSAYLRKCSKAVSADRFGADAGVLMMIFRPHAAKNPEAWAPMIALLETAQSGASAPVGKRPAAKKPAARKKLASSPYKTLVNAVNAAEKNTPEKLASFSGLCEVIDATAAEYGLDKRYADDAKVSQSFRRKPLMVDGYRYAVEIGHPYELYFMTRPRLAAELKKRYTPEALYAKTVELLERHAARIDEWKSAKIIKQFADYLTRQARAVPPERFAADAAKLLTALRPCAAKHPNEWKPLTDVLEKAGK